MVLIHQQDQLLQPKRANFHLLHHACANICRVLPLVISNLERIQPVKASTFHGMVFAAFSLEYFVNPETGGCRQNRTIKDPAVGKDWISVNPEMMQVFNDYDLVILHTGEEPIWNKQSLS
jgi:hypothetical protein